MYVGTLKFKPKNIIKLIYKVQKQQEIPIHPHHTRDQTGKRKQIPNIQPNINQIKQNET